MRIPDHIKYAWVLIEGPEEEKDDLNTTDDGEASEEPHGASDKTKLGLRLHSLVSLDLVECGRVEENLDQLKRGVRALNC